MKLEPLPLAGASLIIPNPHADERGFFGRIFCEHVFAAAGVDFHIRQMNDSLSRTAGTTRGFHCLRPPVRESKLIRCIQGSLMDVIVDLRAGSPTYGKHHMVKLSAAGREMILIPHGFAHGYQTLEPDTEILYFHSDFYSKEHEAGVRIDDPDLGIPWPREPACVSQRDRELPLLRDFTPIEV